MENAITLLELKEAKEDCENRIMQALSSFSNKTSIHPSGISFESERFEDGSFYITLVELDIKL